jgi:hypothetical protein
MVNVFRYLLDAPPPKSNEAGLKIWKNFSEILVFDENTS